METENKLQNDGRADYVRIGGSNYEWDQKPMLSIILRLFNMSSHPDEQEEATQD
jgi:hypothetical protein